MGSTSDILAGRAAVELYLNKSLLTKGLKTVSAEFRAFGAGLSSIGKTFMALGAGITAPLLLAAHSWASSGAELARMSQRTGMAVESLSALKFAAEQTGTGFDQVEAGVKRMQRSIIEAAKGSDKGLPFLRGLATLDADKQLAAIADKLAGIANPAEKAAVAMQIFGRGGTAMLPMLSRGAAGLAEWRKEAEDAGQIRSKEQVQAALQLSIAWTRVTGSLMSMKNTIAAAIAPLLTRFLTGMRQNVLTARDWMKLHGPLLVNIFKIGAAATVAGAALYALGKMVGGIGTLFGLGAKAIMGLGHAVTLMLMPIKLAGGVFASLLSGVFSLMQTVVTAAAEAIGGVFSAALWGAKTAAGAATAGIELFASAAIGLVKGGFTAVQVGASLAAAGFELFRGAVALTAKGLSLAGDVLTAVGSAIAAGARSISEFFAIITDGIGVIGLLVRCWEDLLETTPKVAAALVSGVVDGFKMFVTTCATAVTAIRMTVDEMGALATIMYTVSEVAGVAGDAVKAAAAAALSAANLGVIFTSLGAALAAALPALVLILPAILLIRSALGAAVNGLHSAAVAAGAAAKAGFSTAAAAKRAYGDIVSSVRAATPAISGGMQSWEQSLKSFALSVGSVTRQVFAKLWGDVKAGFAHLVADVGGSWDLLQALLSGGKFGEAFALGLAVMKVEWVRFKNYLLDSWQTLKPGFDAMVTNVAAGIGMAAATLADIFAGLKIAWGDVFDAALGGLRKFLDLLDSAIATLKEWGAKVQAATGNDPVAAFEEAQRLRAQIAKNRKEGHKGSIEGMQYVDNEELEERAQAQLAIYNANKWTSGASAPLSSMLPGARTPAQKAADDKAARDAAKTAGDQAKGIAASIGNAIKSGTVLPGGDPAELARAQAEQKDAQKAAAAAAADIARKQKEQRDKMLAGAGGPEGLGLAMTLGSNASRGTFSASAVSGLGMGGGLLSETRKVAAHTARTAEATAEVNRAVYALTGALKMAN